VTDPNCLDVRRDNAGDRAVSSRRRKRYLPSEQVLKELTSIADLRKLADDLHHRLSDASPEARQ